MLTQPSGPRGRVDRVTLQELRNAAGVTPVLTGLTRINMRKYIHIHLFRATRPFSFYIM